MLLNFAVALTVVIGGIVGFSIGEASERSIVYLLPLAAGGFIYIAASDLIPEMKKEVKLKRSLLSLFVFLTGVFILYITKVWFE